MSATRLLVLGVVRGYGRAHGYLVRHELVSWGAQDWANVKWGSIYHALRQLAKEGLLSSTEIAQWPGRVDYEITERGDEEFLRLLRDALARPEHRPDMLGAALVLLPALPRAEAVALLRERLDALEAERDAAEADAGRSGGDAVHLRELPRLWAHAAETGAAWTRGLIERLERGDYTMAGEGERAFGTPGSWPVPSAPLHTCP
ncbi:PadR family transcriptional regulator [Allostreptomyces psammosilenae]|uniref:DNA-binding PadR family transcriptional regulator n=1 Tax=Allostreptomyces psammosilenae TaxID=1892865 RepID=A0A853AAR0_9ACTN|nr:PadR family transcriptional regulator [Allostreptomyces psammosilenae]NYI07462.1 DNA-binding PadR family transcriptional regulator [Allostreptomyces psammosilenae]